MLAGKLLPLGGSRPLPTFVSSSAARASGTTVSVSVPSGVQDGDLLVAIFAIGSTAATTPSVPAGFSLIAMRSDGNPNDHFVAVKVAASESGSYSFSFDGGGGSGVLAVLAYRNATRVNTVGASATDAAAPSITPTYRGTLLAMFSNRSTATVTTPPSGMTERALVQSTNPCIAVYDVAQEATATGTKSITWSTGSYVSILLQVTNEPDVEPDFVAMAQTQNGSSSASLVINKPTGTQEGDLMVAVMAGNVSATFTGDTGWTEIADQGVSPSLRVAYKVAGASEGASYTFTSSSSSTTLTGAILTYRYAAYDTIAGSFTTGADPLVLTSISPTASQSILIAAGATSGAGDIIGTPTSMTMRATDTDGTKANYTVSDQSVAAGPTGTRSMSTGGTTGVAGIMLSIKPTRSL